MKYLVSLFVIFSCFQSFAQSSDAQTKANDALPINFSADEAIYDSNTGVITAVGGVKANQGKSTLSAPEFEYNTKRQEFYADKGVTINKASGEKLNIDSVIFDEKIDSMRVNQIQIDISEASLIAESSYKEDGNMVLRNISYTACDRSKCPTTWEITANKVIRTDTKLKYQNAVFWFYDIPVFYIPVFSHPDIVSKRESGFLVPTFGTSKDLGATLDIPYYITWSPYSELILSPKITSKEGVLYAASYKQNTSHIKSQSKGAYTATDSNYDDRGYLFSKNDVYIDDIWRGLIDIQYASDDTFLRKYDISNEAYLRSTIKLEGLSNRNYFSIYMYQFHDMRNDELTTTGDQIPLVLPAVNYLRKFEPFSNGAYFTIAVDTASLYFQDDQSSQRFSGELSFLYPYITRFGLMLDFEVKLREDLYYLSNVVTDDGRVKDAFSSRTTPITSVKVHMPFYKHSQNFYQIIDPMVQLVSSPNRDYTGIPNWDSNSFVFDSSNVFSLNRFEGYDRVEAGNRLNYGVWWNIFGKTFGKINTFLGQTYNLSDNSTAYTDVASYDHQSDYVGSIFFYPSEYIRFNYKFLADNKDFSFSRNEFNMVAGNDDINFRADYIYDKEPNSLEEKRQEIYGRIYVRPFRKVAFYLLDRYDIAAGEQREIGGGFIFEVDCFKIDIGAKREYVSDRDYQGQESIAVHISLKTLGTFGIGEGFENLEKKNAW